MISFVKMTRVAQLRATGWTWARIAEKLEIHEGKLLRWTQKYPDRWDWLIRDAIRNLARECWAEAVMQLRQDLRNEKGKDRRDAATKLIQSAQNTERNTDRDPEAPPILSPAIFRMAEYVQKLDNHQLDQLMQDLDVAKATLAIAKPIVPE